MTFIIGISSFYHDSSVSIVKDNILIDYLKEESFTRVKGTNIFPKRALSHLVKKYDLSNSNVDACVFYEKPFLSWSSITLFSLAKPFLRWKISSNQFKKLWTGSLSFSSYTKKLLKIDDKKHLYAAHHMSHALTAISFDKFKDNKDRLIFVIDAVGDGETISIFKNRNNKFFKIFVESFPNSIGLFYSAVTDYLGYSINEGEYKVMGLASYGNPIHKDYIHENIISWKDEKLFFNPDWFDFDKNPEKTYSVKFEKYFGKIPQKKDFSNQRSSEFKKLANIASSFQIVLEEGNNTTKINSQANNLLGSLLGFDMGSSPSSLATEVIILESPSVLKPIYNYAKDLKILKESSHKKSFEDWSRTKLRIKLEEGTSVLNISYIDTDKEDIILILEKLSKLYQDYSGLERKEKIDSSIQYVKSQLNSYKEIAEKSNKLLDSYELEYGITSESGVQSLAGIDIQGILGMPEFNKTGGNLISSAISPSGGNPLSKLASINQELMRRRRYFKDLFLCY